MTKGRDLHAYAATKGSNTFRSSRSSNFAPIYAVAVKEQSSAVHFTTGVPQFDVNFLMSSHSLMLTS